MPVTHTVERGGSYVRATATGALATEEVCDYIDAVETDGSVIDGFAELFDVRGVTKSQIDESGLARIAEAMRASRKRSMGSKLAIVVARGETFDRARYLERIVQDSRNIIVFNEPGAAEIWLGVKQGDVEPSG